ncbi:MAG: glycosyltransferase [Geodermatophilaceae bacterium]|nr:glycosyltransferase [Geodermatophilaceae bacterium]
MLVLHVQETPPGGVVNYLRELTGEQASRGHEVHLLSPVPELGWQGVIQHHWVLARKRPLSYPPAVVQFLRTVRRLRPDVIHLHSFWAGQFGRPPLLSKLVTAPIVYQPHAWSVDLHDDPRFRRLVWAVERRASRSTDGMVANCWDEIAEGHSAGIRTPGRALGVPLNTDHFHVAESGSRARYRDALNLTGPRVVLCLGRITRQKGQDQLVAAWEANPIPDTELIFVGTGDVTHLRELAPTQWDKTVRSFPAQIDVRPWIWACDVLVQPSRYETVGLSIAEAMSCGRPVVATSANGVSEVVGGDPPLAGGAVVPLGAMDALLRECLRRLDDPELWEREARQARHRAEAQFSPCHVVDQLDLAYDEARQAVAVR